MQLRSGADYTIPMEEGEDDNNIVITTLTVVTAPDTSTGLNNVSTPPDTLTDKSETFLLSTLETVGRAAYVILSPLVRRAYASPPRAPFPILELPADVRSRIYAYALHDHTSVRITEDSIRSTPHPLLLVSHQLRREALDVMATAPIHVACELASIDRTRRFLKRFDNKKHPPRQRDRLRLRIYAGGHLSRDDEELYEDWLEDWHCSMSQRPFRGVSVQFLPKCSTSEWDAQDYVDHRLRTLRQGLQALQDSGVLDLVVSVLQAVCEANVSANDAAAATAGQEPSAAADGEGKGKRRHAFTSTPSSSPPKRQKAEGLGGGSSRGGVVAPVCTLSTSQASTRRR
ncbi:hypothetical protein LTR36_001515 [Oleoguttula mirabilis]|uniref:Uncharacterized protein n=1 Tax=Oleoguttula mirabilis TaxID=1507867 RepID=A0AAV9JN50_9PEZI|nr:hypothetical protein LTR36_001515 [Oleoguttula mirabilis]